jgi:oligopeptidase A
MQSPSSPSDSTNPLTHISNTAEVPFDAIRAEHVEPAADALIADARARLAALEADDRPRSYTTVLDALEDVAAPLGDAMAIVMHLESVATTPALREAYAASQPKVSALFTEVALSGGVYRAVRDFAATDEAKSLAGVKKRLLTKTLDDLVRSGAALAPEKKARLAEIEVLLTKSTVRFSENVLDATNAFELTVGDRARLAGLPESAIESARESAAQRGRDGYRLTLHGPSYLPAMMYLEDAALRESLYRAYHTRATDGAHDNRAVVATILELRAEKARLLGYASFADLVLADRMAKDAKTARAFVDDLRSRLDARFRDENAELEAFAHGEIRPWDLLYFAEQQRRARFDLDEEQLRAYFPADGVLRGFFEIAQRLYGVRIEPWEGARAWHGDVRAFRVKTASGEHVASFYVDLFPRDTKQEGAWMHGMLNGAGTPQSPHLAVVCANVSPRTAGAPPLLRVREVETIFHELGHLMHQCLSKVPIRSLAGTNVATDFVELPSKIMENWVWEKDALDLFAAHWQTNAKVPADLFAKLKSARTYRSANALVRQLGFSALDLSLHTTFDGGDVLAFARDVVERFSPVRLPDDYAMVASFSHLFAATAGYAGGYYSYPWADVLDADAFTRFKKEGLLSSTVGREFEAAILAAGNSDDPMELWKRFMGREPSIDALLARVGIA